VAASLPADANAAGHRLVPARFPKGTRRADTSFLSEFPRNSTAAPVNAHAAAWARHYLEHPQPCGLRLVAHRLAHLLAFGFRRLRLHVPRWSEIRERRVGAVDTLARSVMMTKCGREKSSPRQYSRGRTPLPHKIPRGKIFAALRIRFSNPCSACSCNRVNGFGGIEKPRVSRHRYKICTCKRQSPSKVLTPKVGSPAWIRTTIHGSKGRCPTIRRPGIFWRG
jgi:hypothetical protein